MTHTSFANQLVEEVETNSKGMVLLGELNGVRKLVAYVPSNSSKISGFERYWVVNSDKLSVSKAVKKSCQSEKCTVSSVDDVRWCVRTPSILELITLLPPITDLPFTIETFLTIPERVSE